MIPLARDTPDFVDYLFAFQVVYFTSLFPYVVIFALIIRGVTLPG